MRSQRSASFMKWVEMKIVTPSWRDSSISSSQKLVAGHRIDARGRLVEDQHLRLVDHRHGQRQALAHAERQRVGQRVHASRRGRSAATSSSIRAGICVCGQVKQPGVQDQVLPHRQLGVEREGLRHVADARRIVDVAGIDRLAEQPAPRPRWPAAGRSASSSSWTCRSRWSRGSRRSRPARSEADVVDGDEVAEAAGQVARPRWPPRRSPALARRDHQLAWPLALCLRQQGDEGLLQRARCRCAP